MGKRSIRLKEWETSTKRIMRLNENLISNSDGSLLQDDYRITTDNNGFIINPSRNAEFCKKVILLGDSIAECTFIQEGHRLTDVTEEALRLKGAKVRLENGARSGATSLHHLLLILAKLIPLKPDVIVMMNGVIDADALLLETGYWSSGDYYNPLMTDDHLDISNTKNKNGLVITDRYKILRIAADVCSLFGIGFCLATFPIRGEDVYKKNYIEKHGARDVRLEQITQSTRIAAANNGIPLIDLALKFSNRTDIFYDLFHLNDLGAKLLGTELANSLLEIYSNLKND